MRSRAAPSAPPLSPTSSTQRARARSRAPKLDVVLPDDPRVRDLRVTPHALDAYDALAKPKEKP
jgi:hypothetical protein